MLSNFIEMFDERIDNTVRLQLLLRFLQFLKYSRLYQILSLK